MSIIDRIKGFRAGMDYIANPLRSSTLTYDECIGRAEVCDNLAREADNADDKEKHLRYAQQWREQAKLYRRERA